MEAKKIITFFLVSLLISMEVYLQDKSPRGLEGIERFRIVIMGVSEDAKNLGIDRSYIQGMLLLRLIAENIEFTFDRPFYKKSTEVLDHLYNPKAPILFVEISVSGNAFSIQFEVHEVVFSSKSKAYKSGEVLYKRETMGYADRKEDIYSSFSIFLGEFTKDYHKANKEPELN
jgi:hypothetical protein